MSVQLFPHSFYYEPGEAIGDSVCDQSFIEADRVMHTRDRNGACYADKRPNVPHALAGGWEGCRGEECPEDGE